MKTIRQNVFETNSSSTHSVSIRKSTSVYDTLPVDDYDNTVHIPFGEFGWEIENYTDAMTKASYALTMVAETELHGNKIENTNGFQQINDVVASVMHCNGITPELIPDPWGGSEYGYIDHQSYECYYNLEDFLRDWGVSLEEFIFDEKVVLRTDNDNH